MRTLTTRLAFSTLVLLSVLPGITRAELAKINLIMTATLVTDSCEVSADSQSIVVNMGSWAAKQFTGAGQSVTPTRFVINLENCTNLKKGVSLTFNGIADATDPTLLAISEQGAAQNIAIAILDQDRTQIPLGQTIAVTGLGSTSQSASMVFFSQYRATAARVIPGKANADATFTLSYE
ncbi:adhesin [Pseudomonas brenneri]|uniref:Fimbrial protein n=1 Tax=Pseudomonas brenneri TaxID=129817 RepID=A0A5B2V438_9PSED|nr:fimbrial protein [Pseudomonas brenneri]KAA2233666.1 fimbrial protein [Pseudomonas brenneri]TWR82100.1 fimbrial protein [Pseudomonas brenneri]GGL24817.1 adhesin [Pseudomonas brenneri]SDU93446.1 Fimbrial protein [Pseudomonas brenneri]